MTRTFHLFSIAVIALTCGAAAEAQVPAPPAAPSAAAARPPQPAPAPAPRAPRPPYRFDAPDVQIELPEPNWDAIESQWQNLESHWQDLEAHWQNLELDFPNVDWPDFQHLEFPELHFDFPDLHVELPELVARAQAPVPPVPPAPAVPYVRVGPGNLYEQARGFIDRDQYERALTPLNRLIETKGARADAAMYWKAYSLSKMARHADALGTLAEMRKQFPNSSWIRDVGALEVEVRQASGQAVSAEAQTNEDLKLLALQGIMRSDPETAMPVIEKMMAGSSSVRVKERALFVVSQSGTPRGRALLVNTAKAATNPDLKIAAIRYLGRVSDTESQQTLDEIYRATNDGDVKRAALRALSEARATDRLGTIARSEKDADLRIAAVRYIGMSNTPQAPEILRSLYTADSTLETRRAVLDALSRHRGGAPALVALARAEKNEDLKRDIVRRLSNMRSPEAREYLLELLK
jgi:hypothetical protein